VGIESDCEIFDLELYENRLPSQIAQALGDLPHGLKCVSVSPIPRDAQAPFAAVTSNVYEVDFSTVLDDGAAQKAVDEYLSLKTDPVEKSADKIVDARQLVLGASIIKPGVLELAVSHDPVKPGLKQRLLAAKILGLAEDVAESLPIRKVKMTLG